VGIEVKRVVEGKEKVGIQVDLLHMRLHHMHHRCMDYIESNTTYLI
jgi:hypothetical protein